MDRKIADDIRRYAYKSKLAFTDHSMEKMRIRAITEDEVYSCVMYGSVIDYQYHGRDIKILYQQPICNNIEHYVVVANDSPYPQVITVCLTLQEVWDEVNGTLRRK